MITLFGPGVAYGTRTDASGTTPCNFGKVKSVSLDVSATTKGNTGQFQVPFDFGRGEIKITGKLKLAALSPLAFMNLFWGISSATGQTLTQFLEAGTPTANAYQVTQHATFVAPLEVLYASGANAGQPLQLVTGTPAAGQYSQSGGTITTAAADNNPPLLVSYTYTAVGGFNLTIVNQLQGFTPTFSMVFYNTKNGKPVTYTLPFCTSDKLNRDFKENDFANPEIDVMVGANAAGQVIVENYPELS